MSTGGSWASAGMPPHRKSPQCTSGTSRSRIPAALASPSPHQRLSWLLQKECPVFQGARSEVLPMHSKRQAVGRQPHGMSAALWYPRLYCHCYWLFIRPKLTAILRQVLPLLWVVYQTQTDGNTQASSAASYSYCSAFIH